MVGLWPGWELSHVDREAMEDSDQLAHLGDGSPSLLEENVEGELDMVQPPSVVSQNIVHRDFLLTEEAVLSECTLIEYSPHQPRIRCHQPKKSIDGIQITV